MQKRRVSGLNGLSRRIRGICIQALSGNADTVSMMSVGTWFAIGAVVLLSLSAVVGLLISAVLGSVSRNVSELLEAESNSLMPLTRARLPRDKS